MKIKNKIRKNLKTNFRVFLIYFYLFYFFDNVQICRFVFLAVVDVVVTEWCKQNLKIKHYLNHRNAFKR